VDYDAGSRQPDKCSLTPAARQNHAASVRNAGLIEALVLFALIMAYIWRLRAVWPSVWILAISVPVISHLARRERAQALGFCTTNFSACIRRFGPALIAIVAILIAAGLLAGTMRRMCVDAAMASFGLYLPWGLFQQYLLNGYFLRRFEMALRPGAAGVLASVLFSLAHLPNWFLMPITLVGGYAAILIYRKYRNLYFLAIAHAIIGFLLFAVAPDSLIHHLRVGPGWFKDAHSAGIQTTSVRSRQGG
jgi:membrane protease YdiL (CAAX protease family)